MKTTKKNLAIAALSFLLSLSVLSSLGSEYESNLEKNFPVTPGGTLNIDADRGAIDVATDGSGQVEIKVLRVVKGGTKAQADKLFTQHQVNFQQQGNVISVVAKSKPSVLQWRTGQPFLQVRYQVRIPTKLNVELQTAGGNIRVGDLDGYAKVHTSSGSIALAKVAGQVDAGNSGGDISIEAAAGEVAARTSSGSIRIQKAGGKVESSNSGGNIRIDDAAADVQVSTSSGSITVGSAQGAVEARNSGGDIRIDSAGGNVKASTSSGSIHLGSSKGKEVVLKNSGGNISVDGAASNLSAQTSSGSITIKTAGGALDLKDSGGSISVEDAGGTVVAETSSGSITVKRAKGKVDVRNSGGDLNIEEAGGGIFARTSSGAIRIGVAKGPVEAKNSGGSIKVGEARDVVQANTSSGTINVAFAKAPGAESRLEVSGGGINLALPANAAVDVDALANGGRVTSDLPMARSGNQKNGALQAKLNGGGPALVLRSSSGDIHLKASATALKPVEAEEPAK